MSDQHVKEFTGRLRRIDRIHRRGGGFEAEGTLGQSHYTRERARRNRRSSLGPALLVLGVMIAAKATLMVSKGEEAYRATLAKLETGTLWEQAGAVLMAVDPLTLALADWLAPAIG